MSKPQTYQCGSAPCAPRLPPCSNHRMTVELHTNCTVEVLRCPNCGYTSVAWWPIDQPPMIVRSTESE